MDMEKERQRIEEEAIVFPLYKDENSDKKAMKRMGKNQELVRNFRLTSSIGFTCSVMGTWEILYTQNFQALVDGGKAGMFWSYIWVYIGQTFIVLSLAEMASMAPTAGGQYHWVSEFAPRRYQKLLSYASGCLCTLGWQCFVAADASICANLILAMASINNPSFVPERWMNTVILIVSVLVMAFLNIFASKLLPKFEAVFGVLHFVCILPVVIPLLVGAPLAKSSDVFLNFTQNGGNWPTTGLSLMIGQVSALYTVQASDSVAHISEEIQGSTRITPLSMVYAFVLNIPLAFAVLLAFLYTIGDLSQAVAAPSGFPFIYGLQQALNTAGVMGITFLLFFLLFMISTSCMTSTSRQTWAFARDQGLPGSSFLGKVSTRFQVPVNSILATAAFTIVLSLIYIGSLVAFNAFVSVSVVAVMATYAISIGCVLHRRITAPHTLPHCQYSLGSSGIIINSIGLLFCIFSCFWSFWPIYFQPDVENFNWAIVIFVAVILLNFLYYALYARKHYEGPVTKIETQEM